METYPVCGIPITAATPEMAVSRLVNDGANRRRTEVHLCNAYTLSLVDSDPKLRSALVRADLNLPDGTPVAALGKRFGTRGPVRGPGLLGDVAREGTSRGLRHYFFGGKPGVADSMVRKLTAQATGLQVAGVESPPFRDLDDDELGEVSKRVINSEANIIWIGLGTPRQDYLVPRLAELLQIPVVPIGAAFDFWAGNVREAPRLLHGSGLEWTFRLAREPRRLWRRYLIGNPRFLTNAVRHHVRDRK